MTIHVQIAHLKLFSSKKKLFNEVVEHVVIHVQQSRKKGQVLLAMQLLHFLVPQTFLKNWSITTTIFEGFGFILARVTCICLVVKLFCFKGLFYANAPMFNFHFDIILWKKCCLPWSRRPWTNMFLLSLAFITIMSISFDMWMSYNNVDIFALVINFLNDIWVPMHIIMGLFEVMIG